MVLWMALVDDFLSCRYFWMSSSLPSATKMAHFPCRCIAGFLRRGGPGVSKKGDPSSSLWFPRTPSPWTPKVLPNKLHRKHRGIHIHLKAARKPQQLPWSFCWENPASNTFPSVTGCSGQCCGCMVWSLRPGRICWRPRSTCTFTGQQGIKWINPSIHQAIDSK